MQYDIVQIFRHYIEIPMREFVILLFAICVLVGCSNATPAPLITYRVNTATQQQIAYLQIDPNGYVTRTMKNQTDEFQLGQTDFALILDQIRAADFATMRLPNTSTTEAQSAVFHTILSGTNQITFADSAAPESVKPLLVTFKRILSVSVSSNP